MNSPRLAFAVRWPVALAALLVVTGVVSAGPRIVWIPPFADNTGDERWSGMPAGLADLVTATLAERPDVQVVDRERLNAVLQEQALSLSLAAEPQTALKLGKLLGADRLIAGGVMVVKGQLVVAAQILDVSSGTVVAAPQVEGAPAQLADVATRLAAELGKALGLDPGVGPVGVNETERRPLASLHFMRGLGLYHAGNFDRGAMEFMVSTDLDPDHPTARFWLGQCYFATKEYRHAEIELRRFLRQFPKAAQATTAQRLLETCAAALKKP